MSNFDVNNRIKELCESRSWTLYRLSQESGMPYSTLNTTLFRSNMPTVPTLMKICDGFGITLAQFFSEKDETSKLSSEQKECLSIWDQLDEESRPLALSYMKGLSDRQNVYMKK